MNIFLVLRKISLLFLRSERKGRGVVANAITMLLPTARVGGVGFEGNRLQSYNRVRFGPDHAFRSETRWCIN